MEKQKDYWSKLIGYILASQAVMDDVSSCDRDYEKAKALGQERLDLLTNNYILRKKPLRHVKFDLTLKRR